MVAINNTMGALLNLDPSTMTEEQKQAYSNLMGTLVSGVTSAVGGDTAAAQLASKVEVDNNQVLMNAIDPEELVQIDTTVSESAKSTVKHGVSVVSGGLMVGAGYGLCDTVVGCGVGAPMIIHGAGKIEEGGTGLYDLYKGGVGAGRNDVRNTYEWGATKLTGSSDLGHSAYYAIDTGLTVVATFRPVPMNVSNPGSLPARSIFGATKVKFSNPIAIPKTNIVLPYGSQQAVGVGSIISSGNKTVDSFIPSKPCNSVMCKK